MARSKILVFQHVPYAPLGTLDPLLKEAGLRIRYVNFDRQPESRPSLDGYEALIILGGPMNSDEISTHPNLLTEIEIVRDAAGCRHVNQKSRHSSGASCINATCSRNAST